LFRYMVEVEGALFSCSSQKLLELEVVFPFSFSSSILTRIMEETRYVALFRVPKNYSSILLSK
jgi:hypothetical protein